MDKLIIYVDGASRGNPGPAGIGCIFYDKNKKNIRQISRNIGHATNNIAEYTAVICALEEAVNLQAKEIEIFSDSELIVRQIKGEYKVNDSNLKNLRNKVYSLLSNFDKCSFTSIDRENNALADKLANESFKK